MIDETLLEAEDKMDKAVEIAKSDFANIRSGRANAGMFNEILVPSPVVIPLPATLPGVGRLLLLCMAGKEKGNEGLALVP